MATTTTINSSPLLTFLRFPLKVSNYKCVGARVIRATYVINPCGRSISFPKIGADFIYFVSIHQKHPRSYKYAACTSPLVSQFASVFFISFFQFWSEGKSKRKKKILALVL